MNYDHVNQVSDYFRNQIYPYLNSLYPIQDFGDYLTRIAWSSSCRWLKKEHRAFPVNYFVHPVKFAERYSKKCVAFMGSTDPRDGAMHIVYQITPTLHILARLYNWVEKREIQSYMMLTAVYRDDAEFIAFFDANKDLRLVGDTEENQTGFGAAAKMPGFAGFQTRQESE